jgi:hypothetical protein
MPFQPGDRVELVATSDPYTNLRPGDRGTVTGIHDFPESVIDVQWDTGSGLSILPAAGDRIRKLADHPGAHTTPASNPASQDRLSGSPAPPQTAADDPAIQSAADSTVTRRRPYTP